MSEKILKWYYAWGIVFSDIGTSVFYATQVLYPIAGVSSFVFVLIVCLLMLIYRMIYLEGGTLLASNGGAYSIVRKAFNLQWGIVVAVFTTLSYLATVVISALSGTYYLQSLIPGMNDVVVLTLSVLPVLFFAYMNIRGLSESAKVSLVLSLAHFTLLIIIIILGGYHLYSNGINFTPFQMSWQKIGFREFLFAFGAAHLGITGFESLAQIIEHLDKPLKKSVGKVYSIVVFTTSLTAPLVSFLILSVLTTPQIELYNNNLVSGLAFVLGGKLLQVLIVIDAVLILFSAVNTGIVGNTGLWITLSKEGLLPRRLLKANKKFKTFHRPIIAFTLISILIAVLSRGEIELLGEMYGFAFLMVMFFFALGVIVLRSNNLHEYHKEAYKMPFHFHIKKSQVPVLALLGAFALIIASSTAAIRSPLALFIAAIIGVPLLIFFILYQHRFNILRYLEKMLYVDEAKKKKNQESHTD